MICNIINQRIIEARELRELDGWNVPATTAADVALAIKCARQAKRHSFVDTVQGLASIGRDASWMTEADQDLIIERTGTTRKHLRTSMTRVNGWLAELPRTLARHGTLSRAGLEKDGVLYRGGLATALILAGDASALAPMALGNVMLAGGNAVVKASNVEPLTPYLFLKHALARGLPVPNLLYLSSASEAEREQIRMLVAKTSQSIVYGEDRTIEAVYGPMKFTPAHKPIGYWAGRSGAIVFDDADLELAATAIVRGTGDDRGNRCISTKKAFVPRALMPELERRIIVAADNLRRGAPADPETDIGVLDPRARAAALSAASGDEIFYDRQLIFARVSSPASALLRDELPYPICGLYPYEENEDPVALANASVADTPSGRILALSVFTSRRDRLEQVGAEASAYKVLQNRPTIELDHTILHQGMLLFLELMRPTAIVC